MIPTEHRTVDRSVDRAPHGAPPAAPITLGSDHELTVLAAAWNRRAH